MFPNPYVRPGLFSRGLGLAKGINWSGLLDGTQKTLGVINQAIPIVYQVKPMLSNAKTMFKIADQIRTPSPVEEVAARSSTASVNNSTNTNAGPIFYI